MKSPCQEMPAVPQESLRKQRDAVLSRMKKLAAKQVEVTKKSTALKERIKEKYEDMKRVLEEDLHITLSQLDLEATATIRTMEELNERCCLLLQDIERQLSQLDTHPEQSSETEERLADVLKVCDPDLVRLDEFKADQVLGMANNLLLFIRSQTPVTSKLLQSYISVVQLDPDSAHPKLVISPDGTAATYTDTWQEVPENTIRFDTTLNVLSLCGFGDGRHYWEVEVGGKTYWELGLAYPSIPRKGRAEACWLGRGAHSWGLEFFDGVYTAWHGSAAHQLPVTRRFDRVGVFCSFPGGLVSFVGADGSITPLFSFCAGTFSQQLHLAVCPGHDHQGTNCKPIRICSTHRAASTHRLAPEAKPPTN
ncbi:probable E3 ubiquitin-protein ligase TRIML1 [Paramormyrops kingsleyae]